MGCATETQFVELDSAAAGAGAGVVAGAAADSDAGSLAGGAAASDASGATQATTIPATASADSMMLTALTLVVNKSPTCGCCQAWVDHMEENGFKVETVDHDDMNSVKQKLGVTTALASCHTSTIGDYVLEGHVPAADVKKLLAEKHKAHGLTVPGMPRGSPGMEGPVTDKYDVLLFDTNGQTRIFTRY
jgi:hypothetical protein